MATATATVIHLDEENHVIMRVNRNWIPTKIHLDLEENSIDHKLNISKQISSFVETEYRHILRHSEIKRIAALFFLEAYTFLLAGETNQEELRSFAEKHAAA